MNTLLRWLSIGGCLRKRRIGWPSNRAWTSPGNRTENRVSPIIARSSSTLSSTSRRRRAGTCSK